MNAVIDAKGLRKSYRGTRALDSVSLEVDKGRIMGIIGPNGAGKTTFLRAVTGLLRVDGDLSVLGRDPWRERVKLMREAAFIADTATLPAWARIWQLFEYLERLHPGFSRPRAEELLEATGISAKRRIKSLSKGMVVQVHLAIIMAIDARLLILDEPTLGLDLLFRKTFYTNLLNDYFDGERTIVVSTHQVEEVEHILTDLVFLKQGRVVLAETMDAVAARYASVLVKPAQLDAARALKPLSEQQLLGQYVFLFEGAPAERLKALGEVQRPRIADLFVAKMQEGRA